MSPYTSIGVSIDVKEEFDSFRRRLEVARDKDQTADDTLRYLIENVEVPDES